jgi:hypothetical protein
LRSVFTEGDLKRIKKKYQCEIEILKIRTNTETAVAATPATNLPTDGPLGAMSKFIPGEAVAIFIGTFGILQSALETTPVELYGIGMFFICLVIAIAISYYKAGSEKITFPGIRKSFDIPGKYIKTLLTALAFIIWAINIEGFTAILRGTVTGYDPIIGALGILLYTTLVPLFYEWYSNQRAKN